MRYNDDPFANAVRDAASSIGAVGYKLVQASLNPRELLVDLRREKHPMHVVPLLNTGPTEEDPTDFIRELMDKPMILETSWSDVSLDVVDKYNRMAACFVCKERVRNEAIQCMELIRELLKSTIVPQVQFCVCLYNTVVCDDCVCTLTRTCGPSNTQDYKRNPKLTRKRSSGHGYHTVAITDMLVPC